MANTEFFFLWFMLSLVAVLIVPAACTAPLKVLAFSTFYRRAKSQRLSHLLRPKDWEEE